MYGKLSIIYEFEVERYIKKCYYIVNIYISTCWRTFIFVQILSV
jgi:hypothetical protein